jgi:hypothetical protein
VVNLIEHEALFFKNLKILQDLKFMIYERTSPAIDFHCFGILYLEVNQQQIDLAAEYQALKSDHSLGEIAQTIINHYQL